MRVKKLKAYEARNKWGYRDYATVVFAKTAGKAKSIAMNSEACEGCDFIDIEVFRVSQLDKYYKKGKQEMDWFNEFDFVVILSMHKLNLENTLTYLTQMLQLGTSKIETSVNKEENQRKDDKRNG